MYPVTFFFKIIVERKNIDQKFLKFEKGYTVLDNLLSILIRYSEFSTTWNFPSIFGGFFFNYLIFRYWYKDKPFLRVFLMNVHVLYFLILEALLGGLRMSLIWISKPVCLWVEENAMSLLVFYYCIWAFLCCCCSFNTSLCHLSPFQLSCCCFKAMSLVGILSWQGLILLIGPIRIVNSFRWDQKAI